MSTLKAKETLALERGRVSAGETFRLHNKEAAAHLVANGLAEEVADEPAAPVHDAKPDSEGSVKVKTDKSADTRKTKPEQGEVKTKEEK